MLFPDSRYPHPDPTLFTLLPLRRYTLVRAGLDCRGCYTTHRLTGLHTAYTTTLQADTGYGSLFAWFPLPFYTATATCLPHRVTNTIHGPHRHTADENDRYRLPVYPLDGYGHLPNSTRVPAYSRLYHVCCGMTHTRSRTANVLHPPPTFTRRIPFDSQYCSADG